MTNTKPSAVNIGKLSVTGNKLTVEANIYQTTNNPVFNTGDIVSKHRDPKDNNYLLRTNYASISTTNGFFQTPDICILENNKTYHVAMVYDGVSLKFYRNGFLMSQIAASGNLIQNDWNTRIGFYDYEFFDEQFFGYINNVRIWKVARSQSEIQNYVADLLPNPTSQTGLLAYYTFDNLLNKQGNAAWNGKLEGNAQINRTLPNCKYIPDSCGKNATPVIINDYTEVTDFENCTNELIVLNSTKYNVGDTVVIIQMKGAIIDSSNTPNFGNITDYKNAGNYEFNIIKEKKGNQISLLHILKRQYDIANGKVQLVRVPYFNDYSNSDLLTCLPWDGSKGGILVLNVKNKISLQADLDVSGKGFRHGMPLHSSKQTFNQQGYYYDSSLNNGAQKGEGIANLSMQKNYGRGAPANGGGGGNAHNSGGGGGSNGGKGGNGGDQWEEEKTIAEIVGGKGGKALSNSSSLNRLFMGGAGGMPQGNDDAEFPSGNGGGIIIISAPNLISNGYLIRSNGADATPSPTMEAGKDGVGGGGGGGTILLNVQSIPSSISIEAKGGKGANNIGNYFLVGPGGGGGGGLVAANQNVIPAQYLINISGGFNGVNTFYGNNPYGATPGDVGKTIPNFNLIKGDVPFKPNIDSVRIKEVIINCNSFHFESLDFVQKFPITNWYWTFGDGTFSNSKNTDHVFNKEGTFQVKLVVTDQNGCKDSVIKSIAVSILTITKSTDQNLCLNSSVKLIAAGGTSYKWTPTTGLSDPNIANPLATPLTTTKYYVTVTKSTTCVGIDSVTITVKNLPEIKKSKDTTVCKGSNVTIFASGGTSYQWSPANTLSNNKIPNPIARPEVSTIYSVKVTNADGCSKSDSVKVNVYPLPAIRTTADTTICKNSSFQLSVSGGNTFLWSPASLLNNAAISNPTTLSLSANTLFRVQITDKYSCVYNDSVKVTMRPDAVFTVSPDAAICMNTTTKLSAKGGDLYSWSPANLVNNPQSNNPTVFPKSTTTFSVIISEKTCGKKDTLFTKVEVLPLPSIVAASSNDVSCSLQSTNLSVKGTGISFTWSPSTSLNDPGSPNPVASPTINTVFTVIAIDKNGCTNKDSVLVKVSPAKTFFGLPNSFTPNGDGRNDCYGVSAFGPFTELSFSIYNRWGQLVFHTDKADKCWDGTFKGEPQNFGVYAYVIVAKSTCGLINEKGTVTLIR